MDQEKLIEMVSELDILADYNLTIEDMGFTWSKELNESKFGIYLGYNGYPNEYQFQTPYSTIHNKKIEGIISEKSEELKIKRVDFDYTIRVNFVQLDINRLNFTQVLKSKDDFLLAVIELQKFISYSKEFFDKNEKLDDMSMLLSGLKPQEVVPYIQGAQLFVKTILILKEASHPKYEEKRDEYYEVLKKQAAKKEVYAQQLKLFEALFFTPPF